MVPLPTTKGVYSIGSKLWFEYHCFESHKSQDAKLWYRSYQLVTIIGFAPNDGWDIPSLEERIKMGWKINTFVPILPEIGVKYEKNSL